MERVKLTPALLSSLAVAQSHREHKARITSIDFDATGRYCLTAGEDDVMCLYDAEVGRFNKLVNSKKYGVDFARFLHRSTNVLYASTKGDDALRYMSLHDNTFIRYFRGHTGRVVAMDINPINDQVISGAEDQTVRLWDTRSPHCQGIVHIGSTPCVAFDPHGLIFAIATDASTIRLYDSTNFDKGPFAVFRDIDKAVQRPGLQWTSISFSPNGVYILVSTDQDIVFIVDAFTGELIRTPLSGIVNRDHLRLDAVFTPDSKSVLCGSQDGTVHVWDLENHESIAVLRGHPSPCNVVRFNPRLAMMASACTELAFWLPSDADGPLYGDDLERKAAGP